MKQLFFLALFFIPMVAFSQITLPIDSLTQKVKYTGVVQADGVTKDELYSRARQWFISNIKPLREAIQLEDKEGGKLVGKGTTQMASYRYSYNIDITCKDGKYRYIITDLTIQNNPNGYIPRTDVYPLEYPLNLKSNKDSDGNYKRPMQERISAIDTEMNMFISGLKAAMSASKAKDDF